MASFFGKKRKDNIDAQAEIPVRKTEGGRYGESSELADGVHTPSKEEQASRHYFAPAKLRNKALDKRIEEEGGG